MGTVVYPEIRKYKYVLCEEKASVANCTPENPSDPDASDSDTPAGKYLFLMRDFLLSIGGDGPVWR